MRSNPKGIWPIVLGASLLAGLAIVPLALALPVQDKQEPAAESPVDLPGPEELVEFDVAPELISMEQPRYPEEARKSKLEGMVYVRALVGTDGRVKKTVVVKSVPTFDAAALECAKTAVFKPALVDEQAVAVWMTIPFKFALK